MLGADGATTETWPGHVAGRSDEATTQMRPYRRRYVLRVIEATTRHSSHGSTGLRMCA